MCENNTRLKRTAYGIIIFVAFTFYSSLAYADPPYDPSIIPPKLEPAFLTSEMIPQNVSNLGTATYRFPIYVPPGRGGVAVPELALEYNSSAGNSWVGVGWSLEIDSIQRSTRKGLDYSANDFVFNGSQDLVARNDWGVKFFGLEIEEEFSKFQFISPTGGWVVTTRDGVSYHYGTTAASRQENTHGVFKWCLDRVQDTNGNTMVITYVHDQGQIYLEGIAYTGNLNFINFQTEDRPDTPPMYDTHSEVITARRLSSIRVYGNSVLARQYDLIYEQGISSGRSRLTTINVTPLPPATFGWQEGGDGSFAGGYESDASQGVEDGGWVNFADITDDGLADIVKRTSTGYFYTYLSVGDGTFIPGGTTGPTSGLHSPGYVFVADVDGDALADLIKFNTSAYFYTYLSNGDGTFRDGGTTHASGGSNEAGMVLVADINSDGLTDIIKRSTSGGYFYTFLSVGDGTFTEGGTTGPTNGDHSAGMVIMADINGDSQADIVKRTQLGYFYTYLSNGDGTFGNESMTHADAGEEAAGWVQLADVNGDGLADLLKHNQVGKFYNFLSNGDGTFGSEILTEASPGQQGPGWVDYVDVNGDGLADLIKRNTVSDTYTFLSIGDGKFNEVPTVSDTPGGNYYAGYIDFADIDGDGISDLIKHNQSGTYYSYFPDGDYPDLLASTQDSFGASSIISYAPSSEYQNTYLPFVVQTVDSITLNDGLDTISTLQYSYSGGYYDNPDREFRGFEQTVRTNPDATTATNQYHQDDYLKGRSFQIDLKDPSSVLLISKSLSWSANPSNQAFFVRLDQDRTDFYNNPTVFAQKAFTYSDIHGNVLTITASGTGAETVTTTQQYQSYGTWLWRLSQLTLTGSTSLQARKTYFGYENTTGNMLYEERWYTDGPDPRIDMDYDTYGNLISETNARGHTTETVYEPILNTHPARIIRPETNGVSHITEYPTYDYRWGKPTTEIDENGNTISYAYDNIGRLTQTDYPDGGQETIQYFDSVVPRYSITRQKENDTTTVDTYDYYDGFDRLVQNLTFGENGITIVNRDYYDEMGRNYLKRGPYFSSGVGYPQNPPARHPYEQTSYDFQSRPTTIVRPDGIYGTVTTTMTYSGFNTTITDPDNVRKTEYRDYLNRIYQVTEYTAEGALDTEYTYNAAADLLTVTDHFENITTREFDTLGRMISLDDPNLGFWEYTYDENDNLETRTDAKNQVIIFDYDELDRVLSKTYSTSDPTVTFTYDNTEEGANGIGLAYTVSNTTASTTYDAYDEMGRELSVTRSIQGAPDPGYTTQFAYDLTGKVISRTYPDDYTIEYDYFPGSTLLNTVTGPQPGDDTFAILESYEPSGKIGHIYFGNGTSTTHTYDPDSMKLLSIQTQGVDLNNLQNKAYGYSRAGDIEEIDDILQGITYDYTYDDLHRLKTETSGGAYDPIDYDYNEIGNILTKTIGSDTFEYDYDINHIHAVKTITYNQQVYDYDYDENGNMVSGPWFNGGTDVYARAIEYNADNMPIQIRTVQDASSVTTDFSYDGENKRISKIVEDGSATFYVDNQFEVIDGSETKYIFAGNLRIAKVVVSSSYLNSIRQLEAAGFERLARLLEKILQRVSFLAADDYYFHKDHLGSSAVITDFTSGDEAERTEYLPYGHQRFHSGIVATDYKFTDQELDTQTGLYNYDARLYDPVIGRFISADLLDQNWYNPQNLNRFSYVQNNPLKYVDPTGNFTAPFAYAWERKAEEASAALGSWVESNPSAWPIAAALQTTVDVAEGAVDVLKLGEGFAEGGLAGIGKDVLRGAGIVGIKVGIAKKGLRLSNARKKTFYAQSDAPTIQRKFPQTKHGDPLPDVDVPHSQIGRNRAGEPSAREWMYDDKGNLTATRRIDFTDHGTPDIHPYPHQHALTPNNPNTAPKGGYVSGKAEKLVYP